MTLQEQLDQIRAGAKIRIPERNRAIMRAATERLVQSGQPERVLKAGDPAPDFVLADSTGTPWDSLALRRNKALVLTFFRGHW